MSCGLEVIHRRSASTSRRSLIHPSTHSKFSSHTPHNTKMRNNHNNKVDKVVRFMDGHLHMVQVLCDLLVQQQQQQHPQPIVPVCVSNLRAPSPAWRRCCTSIEQMIDLNIRINILAIETSLTIVIIVRTSRCPSLRDGHIINRLRLTSPSLGSGLLPVAATASWRGGNVAPRPQLDSLMRVSVDTEQEAGKVTAERSTVIGGFFARGQDITQGGFLEPWVGTTVGTDTTRNGCSTRHQNVTPKQRFRLPMLATSNYAAAMYAADAFEREEHFVRTPLSRHVICCCGLSMHSASCP